MRWKLFSRNKQKDSSKSRNPRRGARRGGLVAEVLENRFSPSAFVPLVAGKNLLQAGDTGMFGAIGVITVETGKVMVWTTPDHATGLLVADSLTGLSMGNGACVALYVNMNGDIVTNLNSDGTLSGPMHDGSVLLDSDIGAVVFTTNATFHNKDGSTKILTVVGGGNKITGNILAGGSIHNIGTISTFDSTFTHAANTTPTGNSGSVGIIATGTEAGGRLVNRSGYEISAVSSEIAIPQKSGKVQMIPFAPTLTHTYDITNIHVASTTGILAGNGADNGNGHGTHGGNLEDIAVAGDTGAYVLRAGNGGNGTISGGAGGDLIRIEVGGGQSAAIPILSGTGGTGDTGGHGGNITGFTISGTGAFQFAVGAGGSGVKKGGDGGNVDQIAQLDPVTHKPTGTFTGFTANLTYSVAPQPLGVVSADFNGDGILDIATANSGTDNISVQLGIGNARFGRVLTYSAPLGSVLGTNALVVGDFNEDGILDLAATNSLSENVSIFLGNGVSGLANGTFAWSGNYLVGKNPVGLTAADFNTDGNLDLAVANSGDGTVSMLFGNGNGTVNFRTSASQVWLNTFVTDPQFSDLTKPTAITSGDFNNDGLPDLALALDRDFNSHLDIGGADFGVYLNGGGGTGLFLNPTIKNGLVDDNPAIVALRAQSITTGDLNLDGYLDIIVGAQIPDTHSDGGSHDISVQLNDQAGHFITQQHLLSGGDPRGLVVTDVNGDGVPDIISANFVGTISIFTQQTDGPLPLSSPVFNEAQDVASDGGPMGITAADFNGDGKSDVMVAASVNGSATLHLGIPNFAIGTGVFEVGATVFSDTELNHTIVGNDKPAATAFGDFNLDGVQDMVVAESGTGKVVVLLGNGDGNFFNDPILTLASATYNLTTIAGLPVGHSAVPTAVKVANLNGDTDSNTSNQILDFAVAWYDSVTDAGFVTVFFGNGLVPTGISGTPGLFRNSATYATNGLHPVDLLVKDMGGFTELNLTGLPDVASDSGLDLVTANFNSNNVSIIYQNTPPTIALSPGSPVFFNAKAAVTYSTGPGTNPISVDSADIFGAVPDGGPDGVNEIVTANFGDDSISILQGFLIPVPPLAPTGTLPILTYGLSSQINSRGTGPVAARVTDDKGDDLDLNGDGKVDLFVANHSGGTGGNGNVVAFIGNAFGGFSVTDTRNVSTGVGLNPASNGPSDMVVGDFNGDGIPDVATVNSISNDINVFLGIQTATGGDPPFIYTIHTPFQFLMPAGTEVPVGTNPLPPVSLSLSVGSFNQDDLLDLAVTDITTDQVTIFLSSSHTVALPLGFDVVNNPGNSATLTGGVGGSGATGGAGGKLNNVNITISGNAFVDNARPTDVISDFAFGFTTPTSFATANAGANSISVGDGVFPFPVGTEPRTLTSGDFNGDGFSDIATVSFIDNRVYVLLSNQVTRDPESLTLGINDFWLQEISGIPVSFATGGDGGLDMVTGDFNGDGLDDIAIANVFSDTISVLFGQQPVAADAVNGLRLANFSVPEILNLQPGAKPQMILAANLNGDAFTDLVTANYGNNTVSVLLNQATGSGTFASATPYAAGRGPSSVTAVNLDGVSGRDLIVTNFADQNASVLLNNGVGGFTKLVNPIALGDSTNHLYNPDGIVFTTLSGPTVLTVVGQNSVQAVLPVPFAAIQGGGTFGYFHKDDHDGRTNAVAVGTNPWTIVQIDSGNFDLYTANYTGNSVTDITFTTPVLIDTPPADGLYATSGATTSVQNSIIDQTIVAPGAGGSGTEKNGGKGGDLTNFSLTSSVGGDVFLKLANGGNGVTRGGSGGSLFDLFSKTTSQITTISSAQDIIILTGNGGNATSGVAGNAGSVFGNTLTATDSVTKQKTSTISLALTAIRDIFIKTGKGGDGIAQNGGAGGSIHDLNITTSGDNGFFLSAIRFITGSGGTSVDKNGGNAGDVKNITGKVLANTTGLQGDLINIQTGSGGSGGLKGGKGGSFLTSALTDDIATDLGTVSLLVLTGAGGSGLDGVGGSAGSIRQLTLTDFVAPHSNSLKSVFLGVLDFAVQLDTSSGGTGTTGGKGGDVSDVKWIATSSLDAQTIGISTGNGGTGTDGKGGDGGSIFNFSGASDRELVFASGTGGSSITSTGGRGGNISNVDVTATVLKAFYSAGDAGNGFTAGGLGGSLTKIHTNASLSLLLQAGIGGDASSLAGKGGAGGQVKGYLQQNNPDLIVTQVIGGSGGFGSKLGGKGGDVSFINAFGSIGDFQATTYGLKSASEFGNLGVQSHVHIGGIFAGAGGNSNVGGKVGLAGNVAHVTAAAISNIVAGTTGAPVAANSVSGIVVTALGFVGTSPLGRDVDGDTGFDFQDSVIVNGLFDAGEAPLEGLIMANKISGVTVKQQATNDPAVMTVPLFEYNPLTGQRIGSQDAH